MNRAPLLFNPMSSTKDNGIMVARQDETALNLPDLPSDVVRQIIRVGVECIEKVKLISHRWHDLALDHNFNDRSSLPMIPLFSWYAHKYLRATLGLSVSTEYRNYFGVENWQHAGTETVRFLFDENLLNKNRKSEWFIDRVNCLFNRCSHIRNVELSANWIFFSTQYKEIKDALTTVPIQTLTFSGHFRLNDELKDFILSVIQTNKVRHLIFANDITTKGIGSLTSYFADILRLLPLVQIILTDISPNNWIDLALGRIDINYFRSILEEDTRLTTSYAEQIQPNGNLNLCITVNARKP